MRRSVSTFIAFPWPRAVVGLAAAQQQAHGVGAQRDLRQSPGEGRPWQRLQAVLLQDGGQHQDRLHHGKACRGARGHSETRSACCEEWVQAQVVWCGVWQHQSLRGRAAPRTRADTVALAGAKGDVCRVRPHVAQKGHAPRLAAAAAHAGAAASAAAWSGGGARGCVQGAAAAAAATGLGGALRLGPRPLRLLLQLQPALWAESGGVGAPPGGVAVQEVRAHQQRGACEERAVQRVSRLRGQGEQARARRALPVAPLGMK